MSEGVVNADRQALCTHRCLLSEGHDDRIRHQYGYVLPSADELLTAIRSVVDAAEGQRRADGWRTVETIRRVLVGEVRT